MVAVCKLANLSGRRARSIVKCQSAACKCPPGVLSARISIGCTDQFARPTNHRWRARSISWELVKIKAIRRRSLICVGARNRRRHMCSSFSRKKIAHTHTQVYSAFYVQRALTPLARYCCLFTFTG